MIANPKDQNTITNASPHSNSANAFNVVTSVQHAEYLIDGTLFARVQFDGATTSEGIPLYTPVTVTDDRYSPDAQLLAEIKAIYPDEIIIPESVLASAKRAKHTQINAWRDEQENSSIIFTLNGHRWDCSKLSQSRLAPVITVAKAGFLPAGFFWTDADNQDVPMTTEELINLEAAMQQQMVIQGFKIHERQRQMKAEVDSLTDYDAIGYYVVGWVKG